MSDGRRQRRADVAYRDRWTWGSIPEPLWLGGMIFLQVTLLVIVRVTGSATNQAKLVPLIVYSLIVGFAVMAAPNGVTNRLRGLKAWALGNERWSLLLLCICMLGLGIVYAKYQRIWPWDEENSLVAAKMVAEDGIPRLLKAYSEIPWLGNQHPPLMMIVYGYAMALFGTSLFVVRLVALIIGLGTLVTTYLLGRELYDPETGLIAALFMLTFPLFLRQATAAMTDVPVTFFFSLVLLVTVRMLRMSTLRSSIGGAILIGAGLLTKYTMAFIYPLLLVLPLLFRPYRPIRWRLAIMMLIPAGVAAVWVALAYSAGILSGQIDTIGDYVGYLLRDSYGLQLLMESLFTRLPGALGTYNLPLIGLGGVCLIQTREMSEKFLLTWIAVVTFMLVATLPDHRYFMIAFPALAIGAARGLKAIPAVAEKCALLSLLYCGGMLYLFVDWSRATHTFLP